MPTSERTVAVVVNWNGGLQNVECVASLLEQGLAPGEIVFVDNGSADGSCDEVERRFPGLVVIRNGENRGFGEGANQGAREALARGAGSVFFVNNDVRPHDLESDPHPMHSDCPEANGAGLLVPGGNAQTGAFMTPRTCGIHDHNDPGNPAWMSRIVIR